jgi:hypothetical protein
MAKHLGEKLYLDVDGRRGTTIQLGEKPFFGTLCNNGTAPAGPMKAIE